MKRVAVYSYGKWIKTYVGELTIFKDTPGYFDFKIVNLKGEEEYVTIRDMSIIVENYNADGRGKRYTQGEQGR